MTSTMPEPQMPVTPVGDGLGEARLVRPELEPMTRKRGSSVCAVDPHAFDGAGRRALAGGDLRAFEGGAGGRGGREQPARVAEHDLGVGADVDDERQRVGEYGVSASITPAASAPTWPAMQGRT